MTPYKLPRQCNIIIACALIHNFIRDNDGDDAIFAEFNGDIGSSSTSVNDAPTMQEVDPIFNGPEELRAWAEIQDSIVSRMWESYMAHHVT